MSTCPHKTTKTFYEPHEKTLRLIYYVQCSRCKLRTNDHENPGAALREWTRIKASGGAK